MPLNDETEVTTVTDQVTTQTESSPENLLSALRKERDSREGLEKQLKVLDGQLKEKATKEKELQIELKSLQSIDPEKYKLLEQAETKRAEDDLFRRNEIGKLKEMLQSETAAAKKIAAETQQQYNNLLITTAIEKAFFEAGGRRSSFDLSSQDAEDIPPVEAILSVLQRRIKLEDGGKIVFLSPVGNIELNSEGKPKSIGEKILELRKGSMGALFEPENTNSGTGATPTVSSNGRQVKVFSADQARNGRASIDDIASGKAIITR